MFFRYEKNCKRAHSFANIDKFINLILNFNGNYLFVSLSLSLSSTDNSVTLIEREYP